MLLTFLAGQGLTGKQHGKDVSLSLCALRLGQPDCPLNRHKHLFNQSLTLHLKLTRSACAACMSQAALPGDGEGREQHINVAGQQRTIVLSTSHTTVMRPVTPSISSDALGWKCGANLRSVDSRLAIVTELSVYVYWHDRVPSSRVPSRVDNRLAVVTSKA